MPLKTESPFGFYTGTAFLTALTGSPPRCLAELSPGPLQLDTFLSHYYAKPRKIKRGLIFSGEALEAERVEGFMHRVIKKPNFSFGASDGFDLETK